jgi:hypothetical protein
MTVSAAQVVNFANAPTIGGAAFPSGAMTLISTQTANNTGITFTGLSGYDKYLVIFDQLAYGTSGLGECEIVFGTGAGPTYLTSGYYKQYTAVNTAGSNSGNYISTNTSSIPFFASSPTNTGGYTSGFFYIFNMTSGGDVSVFGICNGYHGSSSPNGYEMDTFSGGLSANSTAKTAFKFAPSGGTFISGTTSLYGISS